MIRTRLLLIASCAMGAAACDSSKKEPSAIESIASASPALVAPVASAPAVAAEPEKKVARRPSEGEPMLVTAERRATIEARHRDAAGFLTREDLESRLYALGLLRGKDKEAMSALDRLARGKWVLITGPITNPTPEGFDLAVRYTPRDPADPMGLTSQWVTIGFKNVEGYDSSRYRPGELTAVLARYEGEGKASSATDLILQDQWYVEEK